MDDIFELAFSGNEVLEMRIVDFVHDGTIYEPVVLEQALLILLVPDDAVGEGEIYEG